MALTQDGSWVGEASTWTCHTALMHDKGLDGGHRDEMRYQPWARTQTGHDRLYNATSTSSSQRFEKADIASTSFHSAHMPCSKRQRTSNRGRTSCGPRCRSGALEDVQHRGCCRRYRTADALHRSRARVGDDHGTRLLVRGWWLLLCGIYGVLGGLLLLCCVNCLLGGLLLRHCLSLLSRCLGRVYGRRLGRRRRRRCIENRLWLDLGSIPIKAHAPGSAATGRALTVCPVANVGIWAADGLELVIAATVWILVRIALRDRAEDEEGYHGDISERQHRGLTEQRRQQAVNAKMMVAGKNCDIMYFATGSESLDSFRAQPAPKPKPGFPAVPCFSLVHLSPGVRTVWQADKRERAPALNSEWESSK